MVKIPESRRGVKDDWCFYYKADSPWLKEHIEIGDKVTPPYTSPPAQPDSVPRRDPAIEAKAKEIYKTWEREDGYVPWVEGGNSDKQNEARRIAAQEKP